MKSLLRPTCFVLSCWWCVAVVRWNSQYILSNSIIWFGFFVYYAMCHTHIVYYWTIIFFISSPISIGPSLFWKVATSACYWSTVMISHTFVALTQKTRLINSKACVFWSALSFKSNGLFQKWTYKYKYKEYLSFRREYEKEKTLYDYLSKTMSQTKHVLG